MPEVKILKRGSEEWWVALAIFRVGMKTKTPVINQIVKEHTSITENPILRTWLRLTGPKTLEIEFEE